MPTPQAPAAQTPRKGMPSPELDRPTFEARFRSRFADPVFDPLRDEIDRLAAAAWDGYIGGRKSPLTRPAGPGFAEPDYELALDWLNAHAAVRDAQARHEDASAPARILIINASSRSEHTRRDVQELAPGPDRLGGRGGPRRHGNRGPRPVAAGLGIRAGDSSLQGLLLHGGGALPLAVQLLP